MCSEENVLAPERGQQVAAHANVFDEFCVRRWLNIRNYLVENERNGDRIRITDRDLHWRGIKIARFTVPLLAFPAIWRQANDLAIAEVIILVTIQERLRIVGAGREFR